MRSYPQVFLACRYGRCANKAYALTAANQCDFETHFTVVCYDDDQEVAQSQVLPFTSSKMCLRALSYTRWVTTTRHCYGPAMIRGMIEIYVAVCAIARHS